MSWQASAWAIEQQEVTEPHARFVLVALANAAGPTGENAFPSIARLCLDTGLSESTVRRSLQKLEKASLIIRGNQAIAAAYIDRIDKRPIVYNLLMSGVSHRHPVTRAGCQTGPSGVSNRGERGVSLTPNPILKSEEKTKEPASEPQGSPAVTREQKEEFKKRLRALAQQKKTP